MGWRSSCAPPRSTGASGASPIWTPCRCTTREVSIPTARGPMRGRRLRAEGSHRRVALLTRGCIASGIDEPRVVRLAQQIAASRRGWSSRRTFLSWRNSRSRRRSPMRSSRRGCWLAIESGFARDHKVALMGISFSGGLSIVAAGRPSLRRARRVHLLPRRPRRSAARAPLSVHRTAEPRPMPKVHLAADTRENDDVRAVAARLRRRGDPAGDRRPRGAAGAGRAAARRREAVPVGVGARRRRRQGARPPRSSTRCDGYGRSLPEPSATLMRYVDRSRRGAPRVAAAAAHGFARRRSAPCRCRNRRSHRRLSSTSRGWADNVVPAVESRVPRWRTCEARRPVRLLLSGLISHAEADQPMHVGDVLQLAGFWGDLLSR